MNSSSDCAPRYCGTSRTARPSRVGRWRRAVWIALAGTLQLCTYSTTLRHPQTGQTAVCGPYYAVGTYAGPAMARERGCIEDFQRQGYERLP